MTNHHDRNEERPPDPPDGDDLNNLADDPILSQSLDGLSKVQVPAGFLPNVMFRVYETHHREKINLTHAAWISALLLVIGFGLYAWDVLDLMKQQQLASFGKAFTKKLDWFLADFEHYISQTTGVLSVVWQIVTGASGALLSGAHLGLVLFILVALMAVLYGVMKWRS